MKRYGIEIDGVVLALLPTQKRAKAVGKRLTRQRLDGRSLRTEREVKVLDLSDPPQRCTHFPHPRVGGPVMNPHRPRRLVARYGPRAA